MYKKDLALNDLKWLICHKTRSMRNNSANFWPKAPERSIYVFLPFASTYLLKPGLTNLFQMETKQSSSLEMTDVGTYKTLFVYSGLDKERAITVLSLSFNS